MDLDLTVLIDGPSQNLPSQMAWAKALRIFVRWTEENWSRKGSWMTPMELRYR